MKRFPPEIASYFMDPWDSFKAAVPEEIIVAKVSGQNTYNVRITFDTHVVEKHGEPAQVRDAIQKFFSEAASYDLYYDSFYDLLNIRRKTDA